MRFVLSLMLAAAFALGALALQPTRASADWINPALLNGDAGPGGGFFQSSPIPRRTVDYDGPYAPGTIVISHSERRLYLVQEGGKAIQYGVGVGRPGFGWRGSYRLTRMAEWPDWRPPAAMRRRQPDLPVFMAGGPENPLGARALYIGNTLWRIHGSNEPQTIGSEVSSGCIRMTNEDVTHLYERVRVGARIVMRD
ncbi:L,D-transpeptidase [Salinarimonas ramus]|uniref:L,D-transpeptidase n=1 Tax=Salinarimonas ramus TaxID=690164 RepID=A0A917V5H4_9HYPH|nr:L,D-transpeptidase [Salinarimonas ramus]GGK39485.1 L,D-transpeptidase [Salinarimonas ramus]